MFKRHDGFITTAIVLAAAAITSACSDGSTRPAPQAPAPRPAVQREVPTTFTPDETVAAPAPVVEETPATFGDGEAAYHARNYTEAARIFGRYTEAHPQNAWGHFMLGLAAWKSGDHAGAEGALGEALRLDPRHVKSLVNLSRVLLELNRPDEALETLTRAADLSPSSGDVQRLLGRAYAAEGRTNEAVDAYRRAIVIDAQDSWAMNNLGLLFLENGQTAEALPLFARAVELRKDVAVFQNNLGMALEHTGHFAAAAGAYADAVTADPGYEKARRNLARVEQVKAPAQPAFDLATAARQAVEVVATSHDEP